MLALLAALVANAPVLCDGFLTKSICANASSYVSEAPSQHDLHPVPTPHETCDIHGGCPPRTSPSTSWQLYHVLDRDETIPFSQGTNASALAWAGKLVHTADPSCLHGYDVTLDYEWNASADQARAQVLHRHALFVNRTPSRRPTSTVLFSNSTALLIPPRDDTDVMVVRRRITTCDLVIFLHRGALDGYYDFERPPPFDEKRGRRLRRRINKWYLTVGSRIVERRNARAHLDRLDEEVASWRRHQRIAEFLLIGIPEYHLAISKWARTTVPHHISVITANLATAVTRRVLGTILTSLGCYNDNVIDAVTATCKLTVYNNVRAPTEVVFELLPHAWYSAREGVGDLFGYFWLTFEYLRLAFCLIITVFMCMPTVLSYYALSPSWRKFKRHQQAASAYGAAVLKARVLFIAGHVAWPDASVTRTYELVGNAVDRDAEYFRGQMDVHAVPPTRSEHFISLCLIAVAAALRLIVAVPTVAVFAAARFPYRVACNLTVFLVVCSATMQYGIVNYFAVNSTPAAIFSIASVTWWVAGSLSPVRSHAIATRLRAIRPLLFLAGLHRRSEGQSLA